MPAPIGHNRERPLIDQLREKLRDVPELLALEFDSMKARGDDLAEAGKRLPLVIESEEVAERAVDFGAQCHAFTRQTYKAADQMTAPLRDAIATIERYFFDRRRPAYDTAKTVAKRLEEYRAANPAKRAPARRTEKPRDAIAGPYGGVAYFAPRWTFKPEEVQHEELDLEALRLFIDPAELERAVGRWLKARGEECRGALEAGRQPLPGVRFFKEDRAHIQAPKL